MKFNYWKTKYFLDEIFFAVTNIILILKFNVESAVGKHQHMKKNIELKNKYKNKRGVLVANGPSINKQNLRPLRHEITFFINRSFLHKDYEYIQPTFHIIIDNKLASGEWDITFLDDIIAKNPKVIFILNAKWYENEKFKPYINNKKFNIYWVDMRLMINRTMMKLNIDLTKITYGAAVTGVAKLGMVYMGFKEIYFLGKDGDGLLRELLGIDTHFYGVNPENKLKNTENLASDLYMMSRAFVEWSHYLKLLHKEEVSAFNCTSGGIFDMFERQNFEEVFGSED